MFVKVINCVREDGRHVLRAISAESCLNGKLDTAGSLLLAALVESLPLKTTSPCFPVSPVSTWNGEAGIDNVKNLFSLVPCSAARLAVSQRIRISILYCLPRVGQL
jgi:hypothetical protein